MNHPPHPPRWADRLLAWCCAPHLLEEVQGDLLERFYQRQQRFGTPYARRQYAAEVLGFLRPAFVKQKRQTHPQPLLSPMLKSYLTVALRNLVRKRAFSFINIMGLALGMAACLLILHYAVFELSFDNFHEKRHQIHQLVQRTEYSGKVDEYFPYVAHATGPLLREEYGEVQDYARILFHGGVVTYLKGADVKPRPVTFQLNGYSDADTVSVVGNFNEWNPKKNLLHKTGSGWTATLELSPGEYAYQFDVQGKRIADPANPLKEQVRDKSNSLLTITPTGDRTRAFQEVSFSDNTLFFADASLLTMFSFPFLKGDARTALQEINTAVVTESTARKYFGNEEPVGKRILVNGQENYVITGVLKDIPENSHLQFDFLFSMRNALARDQYRDPWAWENFHVYLQLQPGTSAEALVAKLPAFLEKHRGEEQQKSTRKTVFGLLALEDIHLKPSSAEARQVYFLLLIAGFILVIAWINYINLTTARATERAREVGIRKVVGAHRTQLVRQFLLESVLVNVFAAGVALLLVVVALPFFSKLIGRTFTLDLLTLYPAALVAFGAAFLVGTFLSGLYPAFVLSTFRPVTVLKGKMRLSGRGVDLRKGLVVFQFAASVALIVGTLVVYTQLEYMRDQDLGFKADQIVVVEAPQVRGTGYGRKWNGFKQRLTGQAAVNRIAVSTSIPGRWYSWGTGGIRRRDDKPENGIQGAVFWADHDFIPAYGIKLVAGRNFSREFPTDRKGILLNEKATGLLGFNRPEDALEQSIILGNDTVRVLGVMENYHHNSLKSDHEAGFIGLDDNSDGGYYSVVVNGQNIRGTVAAVEREYKQTFPGNPFKYYFLDESLDEQYKSDRQFGQVFSLFASLAILVACLGLFGLASFTAAQRTKEIGIRKVLGASVRQIVGLLYRDFVKLVIVANLVAWPLAYAAMYQWLKDYPFRVGIQWWMFALPGLVVLLVALLTVSFQSIKAALTDPARSLRSE